jgi:hypothetical protein
LRVPVLVQNQRDSNEGVGSAPVGIESASMEPADYSITMEKSYEELPNLVNSLRTRSESKGVCWDLLAA